MAAPSWQAAAGRQVLLLHLVLSPLLFCTWTAEAFEGPKAALLSTTALILAGLAVSAWVSCGTPWPRRLPVPHMATLGLFLFVGSAGLSAIFSISPLTSWRGAADSHAGLQTLLGYLILYLAARTFCRTADDGRRLLCALLVGAGLSSAYALIQAARLDPVVWDGVCAFGDRSRPFGMFGHPNYLAAYLVMAAPLIAYFLARALGRRRWGAAAALALVGAAAAVAVVMALSRAAWLAGGAALLVLGVGWHFGGARRAALAVAGATVVAAVIGLACCMTTDGGRDLAGRVAQRLTRLDGGAGRWCIWRAGWDLFRDRPILGWGPDAFQIAFGRHRPPDYANIEWDATPTRAHNVALHILATQGLVGAAAACVFLVGVGFAAVRSWRRASPADRPLIAAVAASVAAFLVQDLFGFTVIGCGSLFMVGAALLSRWAESGRNVEQAAENREGARRPPAPAGLLVGGALAACFFLANTGGPGALTATVLALAAVVAALGVWRAEPDWRAAGVSRLMCAHQPADAGRSPLKVWPALLVSANTLVAVTALAALCVLVLRPLRADLAGGAGDRVAATRPQEALTCYETAVALAPEDDRGWARLAAAAQQAAQQAAPEERPRLLSQACTALERAAALTPAAPWHHASLGRLLGEMAAAGLAHGDEAVAQWDEALADDPVNPVFLAEASRVAVAVGRLDRARLWIDRGLGLYPHYALLIAQKGACEFAEGRLGDAAADLDSACQADWHGGGDDLTHTFALLAAVQLARGCFDHAVILAGRACDRDPAWATPCLLKARALKALGRLDDARELYQRVLTFDADNAEAQDALRRRPAKP